MDVGGAHGATLSCIVSMNPPHLKGINFDLPHVIENAPSSPGIHFSLGIIINLYGSLVVHVKNIVIKVSHKVIRYSIDHIGGDMFKSVPRGVVVPLQVSAKQ